MIIIGKIILKMHEKTIKGQLHNKTYYLKIRQAYGKIT